MKLFQITIRFEGDGPTNHWVSAPSIPKAIGLLARQYRTTFEDMASYIISMRMVTTDLLLWEPEEDTP